MKTTITKGVDPARIQQNKPSFYVSWVENGEMNYIFFSLCYQMYDFYNKLKSEII